MLELITSWNRWLGRRMFFVTSIPLIIGFFLPICSTPTTGILITLLFAYMTFITALDTSYKDFMRVMTKPGIVLWILILIHAVMPLIVFGIGLLFFHDDYSTRLGLLISSFIPIGVTSIIWTSIAKGDVALGLVAVSVDTLLGPFLFPLFIMLVASKTVQIDFVSMFTGLLFMVIIPSAAGMAVNDFTQGKFVCYTKPIGGFTSKIAIFFVIILSAARVSPEIDWNISLIKMLFVLFLIGACGYLLGYLGSYILKDRTPAAAATMIYNVGMRNTVFGSVLAVTYFPPAVAVPVTLAMLFQQPLAAVTTYLLEHSRFSSNTYELKNSTN